MEGGIGLNILLALITFGMIYGIVWGLKKLSIRKQIRSLISGVLWSIIIMTCISLVLGLSLERIQLGNTIGSLGEFGAMLANYFPDEILQASLLQNGDTLCVATYFASLSGFLAYRIDH